MIVKYGNIIEIEDTDAIINSLSIMEINMFIIIYKDILIIIFFLKLLGINNEIIIIQEVAKNTNKKFNIRQLL